MRFPLLAAALLLGEVAAGAPARAEDYALDAEVWNGLGYLLVTATEAKVEVETVSQLDLGRLRPGDVVLWVYPQTDVPVEELLAFVRDGGHLVVADDLGRADALLEAAGIERKEAGPSRHSSFYEGQDGLPLLTPAREHFLFFNVERLAANHPSVFVAGGLAGERDVILTTDDPSEALVIERRLGDGALLALSDPSLFLNEMLRRFYGNKQFAANVMRLYCDRETCPLTLVLPGGRVTGHYRTGLGKLGRLPQVFEEAVTLLNDLFARVDGKLGIPPWIHVVAWGTVLLSLLLVAWGLRTRGRGAARPPLAEGAPPGSPWIEEARGLVAGRRDADFSEASRVLCAEVSGPELTRPLAALAARAAEAPGGPAGLAWRAMLRIRSEADSFETPTPTVVSAERFLRLASDVRTVTRYLAEKPHGRDHGNAR